MMKKERIIMDVDPGIDDSLAIMLAVKATQIQIEGFTVVSGNVDAVQGSRNLMFLLNHLDYNVKKIHMGALTPLTIDFQDARDTHGKDGIGEVYFPEEIKVEDKSAVDYIIDMLNNHPHEITIVALGPLTNLAKVIQKDPAALHKAKAIRMMGGAINVHGNSSPVAEYNFWVDPHAAQMVFNSKLENIYLYPLDVTYDIVFTPNMREMIKQFDDELADVIYNITRFYIDYHWEQERTLGCVINDPLVIADMLESIVHFEKGNIDIVESGIAVGEAICDFDSAGQVHVATHVNNQQFFEVFLNTIFTANIADINLMFEKGMIP